MLNNRILITILASFVIFISCFLNINTNKSLSTYQERFLPALTLACGGSFGVPDFSGLPSEARAKNQEAINKFITRKPTRNYKCSEWPKSTAIKSINTLNNHIKSYYRNQYYFQNLVGQIWKFSGPNWTVVELVSAGLAVLVFLALLLLSQFFISYIPSLVLSTVIFVSLPNFEFVERTRDYSKAAFVLMSVYLLIAACMAIGRSEKNLNLRFLAIGALLGVGYGFRQDTLVTGLLFISLVAICGTFTGKQHSPMWTLAKLRLANIASIAIGFVAMTIPIFLAIELDYAGPHGHLIQLGLSDDTMANAFWSREDLSFNAKYLDASSYMLINAYTTAKTGNDMAAPFSELFNTMSRTQFLEYTLVFPFEILGRIAGVFYRLVGGEFQWRIVPFIIAMIAAYMHSPRLFALLMLLLCGLSTIMSLQFRPRHFFHMELLTVTLTAIFLYKLTADLLTKNVGILSNNNFTRELLNTSSSGDGYNYKIYKYSPFIILLIVVLAMAGAFTVQLFTEDRWRTKALSTERIAVEGLSFSVEESGKSSKLDFSKVNTWPDFRGEITQKDEANEKMLAGAYLELQFPSIEKCEQDEIVVSVYYTSKSWAWRFNHRRLIRIASNDVRRLVMPVFFGNQTNFSHFTFNTGNAGCAPQAFWVKDFPKISFPIAFIQ